MPASGRDFTKGISLEEEKLDAEKLSQRCQGCRSGRRRRLRSGVRFCAAVLVGHFLGAKRQRGDQAAVTATFAEFGRWTRATRIDAQQPVAPEPQAAGAMGGDARPVTGHGRRVVRAPRRTSDPGNSGAGTRTGGSLSATPATSSCPLRRWAITPRESARSRPAPTACRRRATE